MDWQYTDIAIYLLHLHVYNTGILSHKHIQITYGHFKKELNVYLQL